MLLKRIELHGFKSFADKTELDIGRGVTCLVGPNGCGKSNIVDAVKWALGEQRASALRGDEMADVIFKGNGRRPAMGFAEVTLLFDNEAGELPIDAAEVAITRRLLRSGESGYLINRRPCRLKDIRELFVDTGLGQNAYAVLEQGRIDAVLSANSQQRRAVFEEAAGIQRFRLRKREAARKLEKVDQNLLRVTDLVDELERRVRSLRIQAGRARSYVALSDRLTELKTMQYLSAGAEMADQAGRLKQQLQQARELDARRGRELGESARLVEQADAEAQVVRDSIARQKQDRVEVKAELGQSVLRRGSLQRDESEALRGAKDREARREEAERMEAALAALALDLERAEEDVRERSERLAGARQDLSRQEDLLASLSRRVLERADRELGLSNSLAALDSEARGLRSSRERLVRREAELAGLLGRARLEIAEAEGRLIRLDQEAAEGVRSVAEARLELERRTESIQGLRGRISAVVAELSGKESRRDTLDDIIKNMEGVAEGARALVQATREDPGRWPGVRGLLAELLPVTRDRARAMDAALGHLADAVVVEDRGALERCRAFLKEHGRGAATFLVLDRSVPPPARTAGSGEELLSGVEVAAEFTGLFASLLCGVRLVDSASDLLEQLGSGQFLVTRQGARLEPSGAYCDHPRDRSLGFVERKVERDQLEDEARELAQKLLRLE